MADRRSPIAVFDSGVGGISVLREMIRVMPEEDFLYYGDSKNAPYGTKSLEEVRKLTIAHTKDFIDRGVKAVAIACNTATSAAVKIMRTQFSELPLVGIEPAVKPAVLAKKNPKVLVLATPMTIREEKFHKLLQRYEHLGRIYPKACPGLMEFVETGHNNPEEVIPFLEELLGEYRDMEFDSVVLGCTHYPFVKDSIGKVLGEKVQIFDGGEGTAREMRRRIHEAGLSHPDPYRKGVVVFENSENTQEKIALCEKLLKM